MKSLDPKTETYLKIIELIANQQYQWNDWLRALNVDQQFKIAAEAHLLSIAQSKKLKKEAQSCFENLMHDYLKNNPQNAYTSLESEFNWNDPSHPARQLQERYLLVKLEIKQSRSSPENWSAIGLAMADRETNLYEVLNPQKKLEKRGRKPKGLSVDYERAVWKSGIDDFIWAKGEETLSSIEFSGSLNMVFYTTSQLIDAFLFGLENPDLHQHIHALEYLEKRLKLKGKSKSSLLVGFNRGEKQREELWDD